MTLPLPVLAPEGDSVAPAPAATPPAATTPEPTPTQTQAATPEPAPPTEPKAPTPAPGEIDETTDFVLSAFDKMLSDEDEPAQADEPEIAPELEVPARQQVQAATPPVVQTQVPTPAPVSTPPVAAVSQPPAPQPSATPPSAQPAVAPVSGAEPVDGFESISQALQQQEATFTKALAEQVYKLTPEQEEQLQTNPGLVVAQLMAQVQVRTTASAMKVFAQQMPVYVEKLLKAQKQNDERRDAFWNANPQLNREVHGALANQISQTVRAQNPGMPREQFIKTVGAIVSGLAGVQLQAPPQAGPVVHTPGPVVRPNGALPYRPAGSNTAPPGSLPGPQKGQWETIFDTMHVEDQGGFDT